MEGKVLCFKAAEQLLSKKVLHYNLGKKLVSFRRGISVCWYLIYSESEKVYSLTLLLILRHTFLQCGALNHFQQGLMIGYFLQTDTKQHLVLIYVIILLTTTSFPRSYSLMTTVTSRLMVDKPKT